MSADTSRASGGGVGLAGLLFLVFLVLKLTPRHRLAEPATPSPEPEEARP